jgi:hypothetical protein
MKRVQHPIDVQADPFWPVEIRSGGRTIAIRAVLDHWVTESRWLTGGRRRIYFRVLTDHGTFEICRDASGTGPDCPEDREVVRLEPVAAPQLGQLRFLPFASRPFHSAQLSLALRTDGSVEKLEYKKTKAEGVGVAAAVRDALSQYQAYAEKRDEERKADLTAVRAEEIAQLQHQIDLLAKQKELLALKTPPTPDALEAVREETAAIEAQTALLDARLAQLKAEAALEAGA